MNYFSFDRFEGEYDFHETEKEAKESAENYLQTWRDEATDDGWPEDMENYIGYGKLFGISKETYRHDKKDFTEEEWEDKGYSSDFDFVVDYEIKEQKS